jgi:putative aldouronate transport system substrate-binding protein
MPGYKEGVRMMNKWYNERLIPRDFQNMNDEIINKMKSGVVGAFCQDWDFPYRTNYNINQELAINVPGAQFVPVYLNLNNLDMFDKTGLRIFIPSFSQNPIAALRYLNWLARYENYHFLQVGRENVNHQMVNNIPSIIARPEGDPWFQNSPQNIDYTMPMNGIEMGSQELNARVLSLSYGNIPAETIVNAYAIAVRGARAPAVYQITTTVNQYAQILQEKARQLLVQAIIAAPGDFDRIWEAGIADWKAAGAQEVYNERAALYPGK